ncbi:hypothetical protein FB567DRAFT_524733 [Paraphoma chrysanthemicola]|uniref:Uncharacterized protein n=1 Tax=Paraphoma chrysanthemicola TaxID=798071 RepID=A0A8K0R7J1_9PLEO|nr:hypothetical protein FB567DRAFT_524733 [Paraphoma chrysanthemicola]
MFESFWGRCLLWQRINLIPPQLPIRIQFDNSSKRKPLSWLWMAFNGAMTSFDPKGGDFEWNEKGVKRAGRNQT